MLEVSPETVCFLIVKAHEFDAKEGATDEESGSNPSDDKDIDVLGSFEGDPVAEEFAATIEALNEDEQSELVALAWIGRGDFDKEDWEEALALAKERHTKQTAEYLLGIPLVGDFLEEGLTALGYSCEDAEKSHL